MMKRAGCAAVQRHEYISTLRLLRITNASVELLQVLLLHDEGSWVRGSAAAALPQPKNIAYGFTTMHKPPLCLVLLLLSCCRCCCCMMKKAGCAAAQQQH
jgi:hypothetical protein